ncbi:casein kinase II subunit alpha-1-like [Eucalyptus grandis]|uniref:casein kinase II subunit alpha-1-like n=1 Tax=Eucalyptus grandis TaxID=71139 RepID=UPI00192EA163|nr:casein kinase II subunit alpha-1-like [Eucalyptus grandis]
MAAITLYVSSKPIIVRLHGEPSSSIFLPSSRSGRSIRTFREVAGEWAPGGGPSVHESIPPPRAVSFHLHLLRALTLIALRAPVVHLPVEGTPAGGGSIPAPRHGGRCDHKISRRSDLGSMSKARVYADVNVIGPEEYWDYESLAVQWGFHCSKNRR